MSCKKCVELYDTPIFLDLLQEWFKMDTEKVFKTFHRKGHKIFS